MQDRFFVLAAAAVMARLPFQLGLIARCREHLEPGVVGLRDEVACFAPLDAVTGSLLGVVQDVPARSFERRPALVEAGYHRRRSSF